MEPSSCKTIEPVCPSALSKWTMTLFTRFSANAVKSTCLSACKQESPNSRTRTKNKIHFSITFAILRWSQTDKFYLALAAINATQFCVELLFVTWIGFVSFDSQIGSNIIT